MTSPLADRPHYVYELLDAAGEHVYVGCTSVIGARLGQHHSRDWFNRVARIEVDLYPNQRTALDAERERIELYRPQENTVHVVGRYDAGGWEGRRTRMAERHAAGQFCHDKTCKGCINRAHELNVTCRPFDTCAFCVGFAPWWSLMSPEARRAHESWEPFWEKHLDRMPSYAEMSDDSPPESFTPVSRRAS